MEDIKYLALEGGGGKGAAYLGAILALEEFGVLPVNPGQRNQLKGIVGTSAGSITALLLAMGADAFTIFQIVRNKEFAKFISLDKGRKYLARKVSRSSSGKVIIGEYNSKHEGDNRTPDFEELIRSWIRSMPSSANIYDPGYLGIIKEMAQNLFEKDPNAFEAILSSSIKVDPNSQALEYHLLKQPSNMPGARIDDYLHNALLDKGLLTGLSIRDAFYRIMTSYFQDLYKDVLSTHPDFMKGGYLNYPTSEIKDQKNYFLEHFTFKKLHEFSGIDLVICGTNISRNEPVYFSHYHSPDFPVIEAVGLSMSIPLLFKPLYSEYSPNYSIPVGSFRQGYRAGQKYTGWFCDGGVINNFPLHTFNLHDSRGSVNKNQFITASPEVLRKKELNKQILGLMLDDPFASTYSIKNTMDIAGNLMDYLMYWSGKGAFNSEQAKEQAIFLDTKDLSVYNFSPSLVQVSATVPKIYTATVRKLKAMPRVASRRNLDLGKPFNPDNMPLSGFGQVLEEDKRNSETWTKIDLYNQIDNYYQMAGNPDTEKEIDEWLERVM